MRLAPRLAALAALTTFSPALLGQEVVVVPQHGVIAPEPAASPGPNIPQPPRAMLQTPPKHGMPAVPLGTGGNPQPNDPPIVVHAPGTDLAGDFELFQSTIVKPGSASSAVVAEPSCVFADAANGFYTANWYAARTNSAGATWSYENPYSKFSSMFGGFCCDQKLVNSGATTVWLLQYSSDANGNGGMRLAVAPSGTALGLGIFTVSYVFTPQHFGYSPGTWLDFPDCAASDGTFFFSANVFDGAGGYVGAVVWRLSVADMTTGGFANYSYVRSTSIGGGSYRFTQNATTKMRWGYHRSTTLFRVASWDDAGGNVTFTDHPVAQWSSSYIPSITIDGRDWTGRADTRVSGGFASATEFGFAFHSGPIGARTNNHARFLRFSNSTGQLLEERNVYNDAVSVMYPVVGANAAGHIALTATVGGGVYFPATQCTLRDDLENFAAFQPLTLGTSGPSQNVWGDYFTIQRPNPVSAEMQWIATGMSLAGGGGNANQLPRMFRFGRSAFDSNYVGLIVKSTPDSGASITPSAFDRFNQIVGLTPFYRSYPGSTSNLSIIAPPTHNGRLFHRWAYNTLPGQSMSYGTVGDRVRTIASLGSQTDTVEAQYVDARTLTVQSTNPTAGVPIAVSPADFNGAGNGTTTFARTYRHGDVVTLTAPATSGFNPFKQWQLDGVAQPLHNPALSVAMSASRTAVAIYYTNVAGALTTIGTGCVGSNGQVPTHTATWNAGQQGPQQGLPMTYRLTNARPSAVCAINFGLSTTNWGPFTLPLDLGFVGIPGCSFYHDYIVSLSTSTNANGQASVLLAWPINPAAIGTWVYTSFNIIDPGNGRPTPLTYSNALGTRQGGNL